MASSHMQKLKDKLLKFFGIEDIDPNEPRKIKWKDTLGLEHSGWLDRYGALHSDRWKARYDRNRAYKERVAQRKKDGLNF